MKNNPDASSSSKQQVFDITIYLSALSVPEKKMIKLNLNAKNRS